VPAPAKPTVEDLGIDVDRQVWQRSGGGSDALEVAFVDIDDAFWVLTRVAEDPIGRVLVYNRQEWECFVESAKDGEFDDAM
jgi:hypothetical protein